jgi:hypothetical protein
MHDKAYPALTSAPLRGVIAREGIRVEVRKNGTRRRCVVDLLECGHRATRGNRIKRHSGVWEQIRRRRCAECAKQDLGPVERDSSSPIDLALPDFVMRAAARPARYFRLDLLRALRVSLHLTQAEAAARAGRDWYQVKYSQYERGTRFLDIDTFFLLADAMLRKEPAERREQLWVFVARQFAEYAAAIASDVP